ncbi:helix-turn-helix domain-containing protein [Moheibacter sediminis]|uniref:Helix-turn-helix n=1 Tax=Moheibacter sediminis TaxID=1434700 RepID=A0A1W1ZA86_9FLAO|nr:helix-turn-helix domain-containing protein [Moheibacter sediminis]SMC45309.1 Helix-turn-helix [Moheibacter sediminis]
MSKLKSYREKLNLTQEELTELSGISVRTIQRIEAGTEPKGQTLKILAKALGVEEKELLNQEETSLIAEVETPEINYSLLKIINLSSLPFTVFPPANIIVPLILMFVLKQFNPLTKQLVTVQLLWIISSVILFMLCALIKNWFSLGNPFTMIVMVILVIINVFIILRNTAEIDRKKKLYFKLNFSII